mmetsp:Transcript_111340/g.321911  ORF Transcript_111340/g.321911 Transcript_111340/m.321911 type:complete len:117 (-) Transcript_111340:734-1084(-)
MGGGSSSRHGTGLLQCCMSSSLGGGCPPCDLNGYSIRGHKLGSPLQSGLLLLLGKLFPLLPKFEFLASPFFSRLLSSHPFCRFSNSSLFPLSGLKFFSFLTQTSLFSLQGLASFVV